MLSAEKIQSNWDLYINNIKINISKVKDILSNKLNEKNEKYIEEQIKKYDLDDDSEIDKDDIKKMIIEINNK